jgi:hypothetical protein
VSRTATGVSVRFLCFGVRSSDVSRTAMGVPLFIFFILSLLWFCGSGGLVVEFRAPPNPERNGFSPFVFPRLRFRGLGGLFWLLELQWLRCGTMVLCWRVFSVPFWCWIWCVGAPVWCRRSWCVGDRSVAFQFWCRSGFYVCLFLAVVRS